MLQQPIIYGLPKTRCEHGRPTGISPAPAIFPLSQQQCKGLLLCWHGWFDSSTNSSVAQEAKRLHRSRGFASDGRKRTPARPALGGRHIAHFPTHRFYLTSFPNGHQLASVSGEQGDTRHQIPSACHGGTAGCHQEPCSAFLRLTHGLFFLP